jgi:integrase
MVNLGVKVSGTPPASCSLREEGDTDFERSRATAQSKLDALVEEARSGRNASHLIERLYESKTGESVRSVKLEALVSEWERIPRSRSMNVKYARKGRSFLDRFVAFVREQYPKVSEVGQVSRSMALAFLEVESKWYIAGKTCTGKTSNDKLKLLRMAFGAALPVGHMNPLIGERMQQVKTVFRHPYTPEELKAILAAARLDDFIRPILVVGICTAMRKGDCCLLSWKNVDLENRFLTVKTSKTGQTVSIPIFPMLEEELQGLAKKAGSARAGYVFPSQAKMYLENPDGITQRVKKVLGMALLGGAAGKMPSKEQSKGVLWEEREGGMCRASVRDFHSFRVTWVTLALTAGVPLELVQRVTGHQTTDIVLKHYFRPGREAFRSALSVAMPQLMMGAPVVPAALAIPAPDPLVKRDALLRGIVEASTGKTWSADRARLLELLTPPA